MRCYQQLLPKECLLNGRLITSLSRKELQPLLSLILYIFRLTSSYRLYITSSSRLTDSTLHRSSLHLHSQLPLRTLGHLVLSGLDDLSVSSYRVDT